MGISGHTIKMLWGRAAARCSMPGCRISLVLDETETDNPALVGEMAHIVAESPAGPRGVSSLTADERDLYDNLILLCRNDHRAIDAQPAAWPVEELKKVKREHEDWVRSSLPNFDIQRQKDDEIYSIYVDKWVELTHLGNWTNWTSSIFSRGQPSLDIVVLNDLDQLPSWIFRRIWPGRYLDLEKSLKNFGLVTRDFFNAFNQHAAKPYPDAEFLQTEKFYRIEDWNPALYSRLAADFDHHVDLVQDLGLELTRAANFVCDQIRANLQPSFQIKQGRLSVISGPHDDFTWRERVIQYNKDEQQLAQPYPGLKDFLITRSDRDFYYGKGPTPNT